MNESEDDDISSNNSFSLQQAQGGPAAMINNSLQLNFIKPSFQSSKTLVINKDLIQLIKKQSKEQKDEEEEKKGPELRRCP